MSTCARGYFDAPKCKVTVGGQVNSVSRVKRVLWKHVLLYFDPADLCLKDTESCFRSIGLLRFSYACKV